MTQLVDITKGLDAKQLLITGPMTVADRWRRQDWQPQRAEMAVADKK
jgi:hypothetical protein